MERSTASRASGFIAAVWLGISFPLAAPAAAQLGHVVKAQKISATSGGFTAQLEEMDQFGRSILNLGDLDGDGITDLMVGAHTDDDGGLDKGSVYVLFLHANGFVKAWQKISDTEGNFTGKLKKGDQFGRATANLGDLDGDGVVDVAVSANYDDDGGTNKGAVYVLFLNTDGTVKSSQKISSTAGGLPVGLSIHDEFGRSLCSLGDLDGDGVTELLVGTPEDDEGGTNTGALHVLFLNPNGTVKGYHRISKFSEDLSLKPGDWFGFCSANLGDLDGDGVVDVAVGSVLDDDGGTNEGSLWILFMRPDGGVKAAQEIDELEGGLTLPLDDIDQFGTSVANLGDLDGDGVVDIAVGAVKDDDGGTPGDPDADVGAVYVLFLNVDGTVKSTVKISDLYGDMPYPLDQWDWFGSALARYGGASGDGLFNAVIGCRNDDDAGGNQGAIYIAQLNDGTVPAADFVASRTLGVAPLTVDFTDASTGEVTAWVWNFGDGPQSSLQHPSKTYAAPGTYDVHLTTRGPRGTDVAVKAGYITVVLGPLAFFEASPRTGQCPLSVAFEDHSEGQVTSWSWDFGDGQSSSSFAPTHVYDACGTYTVSLTVTGPNGTHTLTQPDFVVAALQPPTAAFTATPASGPAPLDVQFGDLTTGQVTSWSWDFGDGQGSSAASPLHRYESAGLYTVTLTSSGPGGSDPETQLDCVAVGIPPPTAYFEANPVLGPAPLSVAFSDLTGGAVSGWSWDFGDGASASTQNPVHVYTVPGLYGVTLTATGPGGTHVRTRADLITVEVAQPGAAFSVTPTSGPAPLTAQFTDLSTSSPTGWSWDFGDGVTSTAQSPAHVYTTPGLYTVSLTVTSPGGSDTLVLAELISVAVPPTTADFLAAPLDGPAPLAVTFQDASSANVTARSWDFGDGASANDLQPTHVYALPGTYTVSLTVTSPTGTATRTRADLVTVLEAPPEALFTAQPPAGVAPLGVQFQDQSVGDVSVRSWDFGDGGSASESAPFHVYGAPGAYTVSLTVSGPGGSNTLTVVDAVQVSESAPVAAFGAAPSTGEAPLTVQFADASLGVVTSWTWDFGDGASASLQNPAHVYSTPGTYAVTLTASGPGGTDAEGKPDLITVAEPQLQAGFTAAPTAGGAPLTVQFDDSSSGLISLRSWDFGDGGTSSLASPAHVYTTPGSYTVTLSVLGLGGLDVMTKADLIHVGEPAPVAQFGAAPTSGVAPLTVQFTDASSGNVAARSWSFGDGGTSSATSPTHVYTTPGTYTVALTASGPGGADDEVKPALVTVQAPAPVADFTATPRDGYAPLPVAFSDLSSGEVTSRAWDFGDGQFSALTSPQHLFTLPGSYVVELEVSGPGGTSARRRTIVVHDAPAFADGSFELQSAGLAPGLPWNVFNGTSVWVRPALLAQDQGFPSAGTNWCDIGAQGTSAARPPTNPGGSGSPAFLTAGVQQDFLFSPAAPHLFFDAAFLLNGSRNSTTRNDFMSVDLTDGVTSWNLYYADSFSPLPLLSAQWQLPMSERTNVHVDLRVLFPAATESTVLSLRAGVGNVGGGAQPSRGYVDDFRLEPAASATFRNGHGLNRAFYTAGPAVLGGNWAFEVDASVHPGARATIVTGRTTALGGLHVAFGEALIGGPLLFSLTLPSSGGDDHFQLPIPGDHALIGLGAATQAMLLGGGVELGNAFDLRLGY